MKSNKQRKREQRQLNNSRGGSYNGNLINNGQWTYEKSQVYCPECHAHNKTPHSNGCNGKKVYISPTAKIPRKNASKQQWKRFYDKFVLKLGINEFNKNKEVL